MHMYNDVNKTAFFKSDVIYEWSLFWNNFLLTSDGYAFPWIEIDFGWPRFVDGVNLTLTKDGVEDLVNANLEVRIGYEMPL